RVTLRRRNEIDLHLDPHLHLQLVHHSPLTNDPRSRNNRTVGGTNGCVHLVRSIPYSGTDPQNSIVPIVERSRSSQTSSLYRVSCPTSSPLVYCSSPLEHSHTFPSARVMRPPRTVSTGVPNANKKSLASIVPTPLGNGFEKSESILIFYTLY